MKRPFRSLTAVLLTAGMLVACSSGASLSQTTSSDRAVTTAADSLTTTWITGRIPDPQPPPPVTEPPVTAPPVTEPPADPVTYPLWEGRADIELLAELDGEDGEVMAVSCYRDQMLLSFARANPEGGGYVEACARLFDLTTGTLSEAVALPDCESCAIILENGKICVYNQLAAVAKVYDRSGTLLYSYESPDATVILDVDTAGEGTLWCYSGLSPRLTKVTLNGTSVKQITVPDCEGGYIAGYREDTAYYCGWSGTSSRYYAIAPDGAVTALTGVDDYFWGGGCLYTDTHPNWLMDPRDPETVYIAKGADAFSWIAAGRDGHLLMAQSLQDGIGTAYWVLDYENALRYPTLEVGEGLFLERFCSSVEGAFCFVAGRYGDGEIDGYSLCRWNYFHDGEASDLQKTGVSEVDADNARLAETIRKTWGVSVIYTEPQIHKVASDYSTVAITDPTVIRSALVELYNALSAYPDGFFDDLYYGEYALLEIYLCGPFTPLTPNGITTAEALSNTRGNVLVIGFNTQVMDGEYVRVLAHELLHIMERRIDQIDVDILSEWITLTPGGHDAYYYSYHDESGNEMSDATHTYYFESDPADAYFVDAYSKSFPTEDRARIFEKLMESDGDPYFADSPVLMAKARVLCKIIRENFPSVAATLRASWEID